jgi:hypothetical protein
MGATVELIFFGLSSNSLGEQHGQESRMPMGTALCPGGAASPGEQHAMKEQHAQGEHMPGEATCSRGSSIIGLYIVSSHEIKDN